MEALAPSPSKLERNVTISLPVASIEAEINARLKRISRTAKMPGFRPGKVPFNIVINQYGYQVRQEVMTDAVTQTFSAEVQKANLRVAGYPNFTPLDAGAEADKFQFNATFEVYPDVTLGSLAGSPLEQLSGDVAAADVDKTINTLRKQRATFDKTDRASELGDFVVLDFEGKIDGAVFPGGAAENFSMVLGEGRMLPDFESALYGMKGGDKKSFDLTFPADYAAELAGKTAQFSVTAKIVNAPILPDVDATFAKSLGVADGNVEIMRDEIKTNLARELKKRIQLRTKDQVMNALLATATLDLPRALVDSEIGRLQDQAVKDMAERGMAAKDIQLPPDLFVEQAEKRVKLGLVLNDVVKQHNLRATPEQIRAVIEEHAESFEDPKQMVKWYYSDESRLREVEGAVLEDNVVDWAVKQMAVTAVAKSFDEIMEIKRQ